MQKVDITLCPNVFPPSGFPETVAPDAAEGWDGWRGGSKLVAPKTVNPAPCKPCWQKKWNFTVQFNRSHCCDYRILRIWPTPVTGESEKELTLSASAFHTNSVSLRFPHFLVLKFWELKFLGETHWNGLIDTRSKTSSELIGLMGWLHLQPTQADGLCLLSA